MRLTTIIPENGATALAALSVDVDRFVGLHAFLSFFGSKELPENPAAPMEQFLPVLSTPFRTVVDEGPDRAVQFNSCLPLRFARSSRTRLITPECFRLAILRSNPRCKITRNTFVSRTRGCSRPLSCRPGNLRPCRETLRNSIGNIRCAFQRSDQKPKLPLRSGPRSKTLWRRSANFPRNMPGLFRSINSRFFYP